MRKLAPRRVKFARELANTGDISEAAKRAGYSHVQTGYGTANHPAVQAEVLRIQLERVTNELLPLAVDTLKSVMSDAAAPHGARVTAAKVVLDRASALAIDQATRDEASMTIAQLEERQRELQRRADALERRRSEEATDVEAEILDPDAPGVFG